MYTTQALATDFGKSSNKLNHTETTLETGFPIDVFPIKIQNIIKETNNCLTFPIDYIGASILISASISIGNTYKIKVNSEWYETALLYLALVGKAGIAKTPPLKFFLKPIQNMNKKKYREFKLLKKEYDKVMKLAKGNKSQEPPDKPVWEQILVSDFTPEALAYVHENNPRGIAVYSDELASWFKNFNRYNTGSEEQFWLTAWSNVPITINRKTSDDIFIDAPYIPVVGGIQNKVLIEMSKNGRADNGFLDRILFVIPDNLKKEKWNDAELERSYSNNWENIINKLLSLPMEYDENENPLSSVLDYSAEAKDIIYKWQDENTDLCNRTEDESLSSVFSKFDIHINRFALIIELLHYACNETPIKDISARSARNAVKLAEYFKLNAIKVQKIIHTKEDKYPLDKKELLKALPDKFNTSDGILIAKNMDIPERTFKDFLAKSINILFTNIKHGEYEKIK